MQIEDVDSNIRKEMSEVKNDLAQKENELRGLQNLLNELKAAYVNALQQEAASQKNR